MGWLDQWLDPVWKMMCGWLIYRLQSFCNEIGLSCCFQMTQTGPLGFYVFMECK